VGITKKPHKINRLFLKILLIFLIISLPLAVYGWKNPKVIYFGCDGGPISRQDYIREYQSPNTSTTLFNANEIHSCTLQGGSIQKTGTTLFTYSLIVSIVSMFAVTLYLVGIGIDRKKHALSKHSLVIWIFTSIVFSFLAGWLLDTAWWYRWNNYGNYVTNPGYGGYTYSYWSIFAGFLIFVASIIAYFMRRNHRLEFLTLIVWVLTTIAFSVFAGWLLNYIFWHVFNNPLEGMIDGYGVLGLGHSLGFFSILTGLLLFAVSTGNYLVSRVKD